MSLLSQIEQDYVQAFKNREIDTVNVLRLLKSALKNEEINTGQPLDESQATTVLNREAKKRREAIDMYSSAGRTEAADKEQTELAVIESYLPKSLDDAALTDVVASVLAETGATQKSDMGKVMGVLKQKLANPADVSRAAALVNQKLS